MYGLLNKAIPQWITANYGLEMWQTIKTKCQGVPDDFISMTPYEDELTYQLVKQAAESTGLPAEEVIERIGEHWITYTANESHGNFLRFAGTSFKEFLKNANSIHARLHHSMPSMNMPEFFVIEEEDRKVVMQYISEREGLFPMAKGVILGLSKRFNISCTITVLKDHTASKQGIIFQVEW